MVGKYPLPPEMDLTDDEVFGEKSHFSVRHDNLLPWEKHPTSATWVNYIDSNVIMVDTLTSWTNNATSSFNTLNDVINLGNIQYDSDVIYSYSYNPNGILTNSINSTNYITLNQGGCYKFTYVSPADKMVVEQVRHRNKYRGMPFSPPIRKDFNDIDPIQLKPSSPLIVNRGEKIKSIEPKTLKSKHIVHDFDEIDPDYLKFNKEKLKAMDRFITWFRDMSKKDNLLPWEEKIRGRINTSNANMSVNTLAI